MAQHVPSGHMKDLLTAFQQQVNSDGGQLPAGSPNPATGQQTAGASIPVQMASPQQFAPVAATAAAVPATANAPNQVPFFLSKTFIIIVVIVLAVVGGVVYYFYTQRNKDAGAAAKVPPGQQPQPAPGQFAPGQFAPGQQQQMMYPGHPGAYPPHPGMYPGHPYPPHAYPQQMPMPQQQQQRPRPPPPPQPMPRQMVAPVTTAPPPPPATQQQQHYATQPPNNFEENEDEMATKISDLPM